MNYEKFNPHYHKPAKFTGEAYGVKTSVEHDHSDLDIDQLMDAFETIAIGLGYHTNSWKQWILDRADEYRETDTEELKEKLEEYTLEDFKREEAVFNLRHGYESREELENNFFGDWDEQRMDVIGQNGNEGLHYRATEEDEDEFSNEDYEGQFEDWKNETPDENEFDDYGQRIEKDRVGFEWGDEPEDEDDLFEGDEWKSNDELKNGYKKYKKALKTLSAKQKKKSK
jgi:hypothetical protein